MNGVHRVATVGAATKGYGYYAGLADKRNRARRTVSEPCLPAGGAYTEVDDGGAS